MDAPSTASIRPTVTTGGYAPSPTGRYAPSPTGRMHLGNLFSALMSWLSVKSRGGRWILRIEDLDPQRSKPDFSLLIEDDLSWLGLDWDEGGIADRGPHGPYSQSHRGEIYAQYLTKLDATGYTYPCTCTRADIMATQAPHQSDGRVIYGGKCRPAHMPRPSNGREGKADGNTAARYSTRLYVPNEEIVFTDKVYGPRSVNLTLECGDFILRRADGAWAYQLAVVVDDALMGVTEVVRGSDLLLSTAQQIYLYRLLGFPEPDFAHVPLICNSEGRRLSKRDMSLNMSQLRDHMSAREVIGTLAHIGGLIDESAPCEARELLEVFDWRKVPSTDTICL